MGARCYKLGGIWGYGGFLRKLGSETLTIVGFSNMEIESPTDMSVCNRSSKGVKLHI